MKELVLIIKFLIVISHC